MATVTVTANFLLNEYVTTNGNPDCPYPVLTNKWSTITPTGFKNVMDYGAVGNGTTLDDNAIVACINDAQTANTGVIFPSGHTFAVSKLSTVNLTKNLTVWAYGATIKMADLKKYSWISFSFNHVQGGYGANFIWLGGTIDGNQFNQTYPLNPHGGIYDGAFVEAHGQFLNVTFADFAFVKDITVINTVVDGVAVESCRIGVIANSTASGGALLNFAQVQEQGTYFKWTRQGFKSCYGLDLTTTSGSIGLHVSYPTSDIMDTDTVAVFSNCHINGGAQNSIHIEDCYKVFNNNVTIEYDTTDTLNEPYHVSNRTGVFVLKGCNWRNAEATFNQARDMVLSMVDRCTFTSEFTSSGNTKINAFLDEKGVMLCTNSTFTGICAANQANIDSMRGCTFKDFDALAVSTGFAVDNCAFVNGTRPASLKTGGFVTPACTFTNVTNPNTTSTPVDNTWKQIFLSSVQVYDGNQVFLGVIDTNPSCVVANRPAIFLSQREMTPSGGQAFDEFYWFNSANASLTYAGGAFPLTGSYRFDLSAYAVAGTPTINVFLDNVLQGSVSVTGTAIRIYSLFISNVTLGAHSIKIQLSNFSSGANHGRVGLLYFTQTSQTTPPVFPVIAPNSIVFGRMLTKESYASTHLRGFNLGSNGYNVPDAQGGSVQSMIDMKATGANIARCFVEIYRPNSPCEGGSSTANTYQFKTGELTKLATTVSRAQTLGIFVVPCLFLDPCYNTDYWGNDARKASIISLWEQLATIYNGNTTVGGYDLINEPRQNFNYAEVIKFQSAIIEAIRAIDSAHVVMVECVSNDMFAMMLPLYQYTNVVYSPHGYSTLLITHQGVSGEPEANIRNIYPHTVSTSNLAAPWGKTQLSAQHDDVRIMTNRFHVPVFIGEFSCINWSPASSGASSSGTWGWTSTAWSDDNISLLEAENWSWVYHAWRGDYPGWEAEIPSSFYNTFTFVNATPQNLPSYSSWVSHRIGTAPTIVMLKQWFAQNAQTMGTFYISSSLGSNSNPGTQSLPWASFKTYAPNNTYLLKAGDTFYLRITAILGTTASTPVVISSYGTGANPIINQYTKIKSTGWSATANTKVWKVDLSDTTKFTQFTPPAAGAGNVGFLKVDDNIFGNKQAALNTLAAQWDFYSDDISTLYVWSNGNPNTQGTSIECSTQGDGIHMSDYMTLTNIKVTGVGGTGIRGTQITGSTIQNVDVEEIGGCFLGTGTNRYGDAISLYDGGNNILVDSCTAKQIYDEAYTMQSHDATGIIPFKNITWSNNTTDLCQASLNPDVETGDPNNNGFINCLVTGNLFQNDGFGWSCNLNHCWRPKDNEGTTILLNFWNTNSDVLGLIIENNTFINPRSGLYYMGGQAADPRFTTRNNNICINPNTLIRKNCFGCTPVDKYPYKLATYQDFVNAQHYEVGSTWSSYSGGVCTPFSSLAGTYRTGTNSSTVCAQANTTLYTKGAFVVGGTLYTDSGTTTPKTGATFVVQVSTNKIFNLNTTTGVIGADTGLICQSGTAGTYKTGSTLTTVCSQVNTTLYTSGAFAAGKVLYTDANLTTIKTGATFVVTVSNNHIWTLNSTTGVIGSDTGNICNSGTGATYIVGNTLGTVCNGTPITLYTSGAFAIGKVLYQDINLLTIETGFTFVVQSATNHVFNLNSSTGVVGSDTGTVCGGGTGATYKLSNTITSVCSATPITLYTSGSFNVGDTLYSDPNLVIPETGFSFVVQVSTNHIFNLNSTTGVVGTDTGNICNSGTAGNYITGNVLATVCNGTTVTLYTSGAFAIGKTLYTDINLLVIRTGFIYVVQSSTFHVFDLDTNTGVVGSDTGTICGEVPVDCSTSTRAKYGIYGLGLINNLTQFNAFLPSMQGFHFRFVWQTYETSAGVFDASYLINQLKIAFNNCLYTGLEMFVAPQSNVTPAYVFAPPYNVPSVGTTAATDNTFPYYFYKDASNVFQFKQRYQNLNTQFRADIAEAAQWSAQWQGRMLFMLSAEGYRGDENPYNGTPVNSSFAITEASWNTYKQTEVWNGFYSAVNTSLSFLHPMINQANDNSSFQWGLSNTPNAWFKAGEFGQVYNFPNEKNYAALIISLKTSSTNNNRVGAELETTTTSAAWWTTSPSLNIMAIVCSALHAGVDILAIRPADALTATTAYDFFNKYAGLRNATDSNIGFCALRDVIDLANLNRFSEATYGTLVASSDQANYNTQFNAINASGLPAAEIQYQLTQLLTSGNAGSPYLNAARITNIRAAFPTASYQAINNDTPTTIQSYNQDFGANMINGNYGKFITQVNFNATSVAVWRVTSVSDFWGRFGRRTDFGTSKNELFFAVNTGLAANNNYRVTIKVTYLNNGGGTWTLNYFNGTAKVSAGSTTNGAVAASAQKTFTINDFQGGGNLANATDFTLLRTAGADSTFFAVELTVVSQNTTGTAGTYIVGNTLSTVCGGTPVTLFTNGAFASGQTLYSDIILLTPETGFSFVVNTATNHVFNLNTSTGVVGTDTGVICGSGTAGVYKTSSTLTNVCSQAATTLFTSGSFAVGKTLYTDINLTTAKTGASFLVTTSDNHIYNLNSTTGVIGSDTGNICNSGTAGSYVLGTALSTVCAGTATTLYTSGSFAVGKTLYTDVNLLIPQTGFTFVITTADSHVFNLNTSTGVIGADTGIICGSGTSATYKVGNTLSTVCAQANLTLFTSGSFAIGKTLYTDINLTTIKTGFIFVVQASTSHVFNLNTTTGVVGSDTGIICGSGTSANYIVGNTLATVCDGATGVLFTSGSFAVGKTLYTDVNLTLAKTGFTFVVTTTDSHVYNLNTSTGVVGADTGIICNSGTAGTYILGNNSGTVCAGTPQTLYTSGSFAVGKTLYTTNDLTTAQTGFTFLVFNNEIYNLNTSTGVIGSDTTVSCTGTGTPNTYKVGNTLATVCAAGNVTLYTDGAFVIGGILYTDIGLTTPETGFTFVVNTATSGIYNLNTSTGVIGSQVGTCNGGTSTTVKLGNTLATVCAAGSSTAYTIGVFTIGKTLYSDINVTTAITGSTFVVLTSTNHVYNLNTSTGVIGSDTGIVCGSGTSGTYKVGNTLSTVCSTGNVTLYTNGAFVIGGTLYTDVNLTTNETGAVYVVNTADNHVYNLNTSTGVIGSDAGIVCNSGTSGTYRVGNVLTTVCSQTTGTLFTNGAFAVSKTLYTDINLTTTKTGFIYVEETISNHVYNLNTSTGVIGSDTGIVCGSGTSGTYKLGIDITTVCGNTNSTLYTNGAFTVGDVLYTDPNLTIPQTGFSFVAEVGSNHVFALDIATGVIGADTGTICGGGTSGTYKLGNTLTTVCNQGNVTLYTNGIFTVGGTLYTDINLTIPETGFTLVVRTDTGFVYNLDTSTGVIGLRLNNKCGSGNSIRGKKN